MDAWESFRRNNQYMAPQPSVELTGVDMPTPGEPVIGKMFSGLFEKVGEAVKAKKEEAKTRKEAPARAERTKEIFRPGKAPVTAPEASISREATPRPEDVESRMQAIFDMFKMQ